MEKKMKAHFCTCDDLDCGLNPNNPKNQELNLGCDPCIRKNLKAGEIPSCFFDLVSDDQAGVEDFSMGGFVEFYQKHRGGEPKQGETKRGETK
jgi:Domain of unknown function (DUF6485)